MNYDSESFIRPGYETKSEVGFPYAPVDWTRRRAEQMAEDEGLVLSEDHWEVINSLQEFYMRHDAPTINVRELHDALEEHFHHEGGLKHLYELFPRGPVAQGCRLAGLQAPAGAQDKGFGSSV